MNFKVQFGKKIHKLPQGLKSFDELIFVIRTIFAQKLPDQYTFKYEDSDKDWIGLETKEDFDAAIGFFKENNTTSMKVKIIKALKPALEQYVIVDNDMTSSRIISFANKNVEEDLGESTIFKPQVKADVPKDLQEQPSSVLVSEKVEQKISEQDLSKLKEIDEDKLIHKILFDDQKNDIDAQKPEEVIEGKQNQIEKKEEIIEENNDIKDQVKESIVDKYMRDFKSNEEIVPSSVSASDKITLSYNELQNMIEDIVEKKIKVLLSNYNLVPKEFKIEEFRPHQQNDKVNSNAHQEERKEDFSNNIQIDSSQSLASSQIRGSLSPSEIDIKKVKAILKTDPPAELNVESGNPYAWSFQFQNIGVVSWPKFTFFKCLQGPHKDQKIEIDQIKPQDVLDIKISLEAPVKANKYLEVWSLVQEIPEKPIVNFGPKVRYTLIVQEEESNNNVVNSSIQKPSISISDPQNNSKVNSKVLDIAKQMKDFLGGDIKKYIEFIQMGTHIQLDLQSLVNIYIDNQRI